MIPQQNQYKALVEALLPEDLFRYFEITEVKFSDKSIDVFLDELNNPPSSEKNKCKSL